MSPNNACSNMCSIPEALQGRPCYLNRSPVEWSSLRRARHIARFDIVQGLMGGNQTACSGNMVGAVMQVLNSQPGGLDGILQSLQGAVWEKRSVRGSAPDKTHRSLETSCKISSGAGLFRT